MLSGEDYDVKDVTLAAILQKNIAKLYNFNKITAEIFIVHLLNFEE